MVVLPLFMSNTGEDTYHSTDHDGCGSSCAGVACNIVCRCGAGVAFVAGCSGGGGCGGGGCGGGGGGC
jgi:hypothetical protein